MDVIEISSDVIWEKISNEGASKISEDDISFIVANQNNFLEKADGIISEEVERFLKTEKFLDENSFCWALRIVSYFNETSAFKYIRKLMSALNEKVYKNNKKLFPLEELSLLIASTVGNEWQTLDLEIKNCDLHLFVRSACIDAIAIMHAKGAIQRSEFAEHFKKFFSEILKENIKDPEVITAIIVGFSNAWPGECLDEIREIFGLELADDSGVNIQFVLSRFNKGKKLCLEELEEFAKCFNLLNLSEECSPGCDETEQMFKDLNELSMDLDLPLDEQNFCLRIKKVLNVDPFMITDLSYDLCREVSGFTFNEAESVMDALDNLNENPEKTLRLADKLLSRYPNSHFLNSLRYNAYFEMGCTKEAIRAIEKTLNKCPDFIIARALYAEYLLSRGETEEFVELLSDTSDMKKTFPNRDIFYIEEIMRFSGVMGSYFADIGDIDQAKLHLELAKEDDPDGIEVERIKGKILSRALLDVREKS